MGFTPRELEGAGLDPGRLGYECPPGHPVFGHAYDVQHDTGEIIERRLKAVNRESLKGPFRIGSPLGAGPDMYLLDRCFPLGLRRGPVVIPEEKRRETLADVPLEAVRRSGYDGFSI